MPTLLPKKPYTDQNTPPIGSTSKTFIEAAFNEATVPIYNVAQ
ncbi:MAG: hypothetical protein AAFZ15_07215 [Bacteroidota bacterium]